MAEEDDVLDDLDALEEAVTSEDGGDDEAMDPLAEEMLKMMEEDVGEEDEQSSQEDVDRMMEMEMLKAMEEEGGAGGLEGGGEGFAGLEQSLGGGGAGGGGIPASFQRLMDVSLTVTIELGRTYKPLEDVLTLGEQSLVELDKQVGDPVDILVNNKLFARGEVVTVSENFGVRITELVSRVSEM